jgi:glycosyltransferase involved in cell wall biosynthesis
MQKKLSNKLPSLSIIIPAYNEEESLKEVLMNTVKDAPKFLSDYEVIVINDGSTDRSGKIADSIAKKYDNIKVIHQENQGYGRTMLNGFKFAKKDFIAYMPADGQFFIRDMAACLPLMRKADLILGYRGSRSDYSTYRLILSYGYLILLKLLFGINYQDVNWLNIWRAEELNKLKINSNGIFLLAEIVIQFKRKGLKIAEAPSRYRLRIGGEVKNAKLRPVVQTFFDALKLKFKILTI